ncbi:hypothetical protein AX14_009375 [Amanita brunnescens Koide BX004]|nr:hypothetical protein AX14_009375 [Amanita brunnescens Koide BX004]
MAVISFWPLQRENDMQTGLVHHGVLKMVQITIYIMLGSMGPSIPDKPGNINNDQNADQNANHKPDNVSEYSSHIDGASSDDTYDSDNSEWDLDNQDLEGWEDRGQ